MATVTCANPIAPVPPTPTNMTSCYTDLDCATLETTGYVVEYRCAIFTITNITSGSSVVTT